MPCRYDPTPAEIEEERRRVDLAFKIACKAMTILEGLKTKNFSLKDRFSQEEMEWWTEHKKSDIERRKRELENKNHRIKSIKNNINSLKEELEELEKGE